MAFDVNAACSGFVYGMEVVEGLLATGRYENILLACAEKFSSVINYEDRGTCILFGDGAGCLVLSDKPGGAKLVASYSGGDGKLAHLLWRQGGGSKSPAHEIDEREKMFLQMEGKEVFKHAVRGMAMSAEKVLERAGWSKDEVDWLVPHQANMRLIKSAAERLELPLEKVVVNIQKYGNMSAASIPVAMSEGMHKFKKGDKIVCLAFGAGFTWGGLALEWDGDLGQA
jgi:3-oxoacyl-[acyl-carrier-protein] synthase-3